MVDVVSFGDARRGWAGRVLKGKAREVRYVGAGMESRGWLAMEIHGKDL